MDPPKDHSLFGLGLPGYMQIWSRNVTNVCSRRTRANGKNFGLRWSLYLRKKSKHEHYRKWIFGGGDRFHDFPLSSNISSLSRFHNFSLLELFSANVGEFHNPTFSHLHRFALRDQLRLVCSHMILTAREV